MIVLWVFSLLLISSQVFGALVAPINIPRVCHANSECSSNECCIFPNIYLVSKRKRQTLPVVDRTRGHCRQKSKLGEQCSGAYSCGCEDELKCVPDSKKRIMLLPQHCVNA